MMMCFALIVSVVVTAAPLTDAIDKDHIVSRWESLLSSDRNIQLDSEEELRGGNEHFLIESIERKWKHVAGSSVLMTVCKRVREADGVLTTVRSVMGENPIYRFRLHSSGVNTPWSIRSLARAADKPETNTLPVGGALLYPSLFVHTIPLPKLVGSPGCKLHSLAGHGVDERRLKNFRLEYKWNSLGDKNQDPVRVKSCSGTLMLDPALDWLPIEADFIVHFESGEAGNLKFNANIQKSSDGIPFTQDFQQSVLLIAPPSDPAAEYRDVRSVFKTVRSVLRPSRDTPARDFTLTAFGLPEPFEQSSSPYWLWMLVTGALLTLIALMFRIRATKPS